MKKNFSFAFQILSALFVPAFFLLTAPSHARADQTTQALRALDAAAAAEQANNATNVARNTGNINAVTDPFRQCVSRLSYIGDVAVQEAACNCAVGNTNEGCDQYKAHIDYFNGVGPQPGEAEAAPGKKKS
ncbi:MAG TPA: hypothetical protein VL688_07240 [Verrucomicrobiae bacterium]|jgi:hypothetical protein|nr:hypothetical protein [Verrucomicrobiae bacterium]